MRFARSAVDTGIELLSSVNYGSYYASYFFACLFIFGPVQAQDFPGTHENVPTFGTTVVIPGGFCGDVYEIPVNTSRLPRFENLAPIGRIYTNTLNVPTRDFTAGFPGVTKRVEWFALDYNGRFWIEKPGKYKFALMSDDGSRLYIDDTLVINNDGQHPPEVVAASVPLSGGVHRMRVSYFQGPRFQVALVLAVAGPGQRYHIFSTEEFKPPPNPDDWTFATKVPSDPLSGRTKCNDVIATHSEKNPGN